ncbi:MAG: erythromycin esterase family protein [Bacteroidia bacterium]|nr:erythromycin esterase family protein [Bacteroidia bacterium]
MSGQPDFNPYIRTQVSPLEMSPDSGFESFFMLDEVVKEYKFFFTAEEHWLSMNTQVRYRFLMYLYYHAHVRNLIVEGGYSYGDMLNRYLETGNENLLIRAIYDIPVCPTDMIEFYRELYTFNRFLPAHEKIRIIGIDLEQSPQLVIECMVNLLPQKPLTAGVRDKITQLKMFSEAQYNDKEIKKYFRQLYKEVQDRKRAYRRYWGDRYWMFEMLLENTVEGFESPLLREFVYDHGDQKKREDRMFSNFRLLYKYHILQPGNYYGQFGGIHTELNPAINWGYHTLAHQLNYERYSPVKGKVLTISRYFRRLPQIYERFREYEDFMALMNEIDHTSSEDVILCRIWGNDSLFPEISRDFQFMLIIKDRLESEKCK